MKWKDAQTKRILMFSSPDFLKRIEEEDSSMLTHMDILKKINMAGYLTIQSQGGHKSNGKSYEIHERAYIEGFMLEKDAEEFIKNLGIYTDKVGVYIPYSLDIKLPSSLDVPLTIQKKNNNWEVVTHTSIALPKNVWDMYRKEVGLNKNDKIALILCWDTKWNRNASSINGLFTDVLKILKKLI